MAPVKHSQEIQKSVSDLVEAINTRIELQEIQGPRHRKINGMAYDSREVRPGFLFFALPGEHTDGHSFVASAVEAGAVAVVHSRELNEYHENVAYIRVANPRTAMSPLAAAFYDHPSRKLKLAGVTGTDGKSSTVSYLQQLLVAGGETCGFISTVEFHDGFTLRKNGFRQSTPEAPEVHKLLHQMLARGCTAAVVEATSHGLSPRTNRLGDVEFNLGVLTNISHEHLEFHGTMDQYVKDKSRLFASLRPYGEIPATAVLPVEEPYLPRFVEATLSADGAAHCPVDILGYGSGKAETNFKAVEICEDDEGIVFSLLYREQRFPCRLSLQGLFNVDNALAALAAASRLLDREPSELLPLLESLKPVRGRMQPVRAGQPFGVLIDYAHSPGSFEKLFPLLRRRTQRRLIALFGSAGERDRAKRPVQGSIAARYADLLFLCDEDPRLEDSNLILEEIAAGCGTRRRGEELFLIPDRREAIRAACALAGPGDLLVCLGKGHEGSIIGADGPEPYDEEDVLRQALAELGYETAQEA